MQTKALSPHPLTMATGNLVNLERILIRQLGKKTHWVAELFGNKVIERFSLTSKTEYPNQFIHVFIKYLLPYP